MSKKNFIVLKDKGMVIAETKNPVDLLKDVNKKCSKLTGRMIMEILLDENIEYSTNPKYKATSLCMDGDTFDEKTGKKIASKKSDLKYHQAKTRQYQRILRILEKVSNEIYHMCYDHVTKINEIEEELENY